MELLSEQKSVSVQALAKLLYVSEATVRRDLNALEKQGQVRRVFGGVVLMENNIPNTAFHGRSTKDAALEKIDQDSISACTSEGKIDHRRFWGNKFDLKGHPLDGSRQNDTPLDLPASGFDILNSSGNRTFDCQVLIQTDDVDTQRIPLARTQVQPGQ
jgi:DNA-binding transcriptional MocR family regulator